MKRDRTQNLKPWRKGVSGNPGGRPKKKLTDELERLLQQEAPGAKGKTWAAVIAEALLGHARKDDVKAIAELASRVEGKPLQAVALGVDVDAGADIVAALHEGRRRVAEWRARQGADALGKRTADESCARLLVPASRVLSNSKLSLHQGEL